MKRTIALIALCVLIFALLVSCKGNKTNGEPTNSNSVRNRILEQAGGSKYEFSDVVEDSDTAEADDMEASDGLPLLVEP